MRLTRDTSGSDPYLKPVFPFADKLRRYLWSINWLLLCRWTPNPMHNWRIFILSLFGAKIGKGSAVYPSCKIWAPWMLIMGDVSTIGPGVEIYNPGGLRLGHHAILSQDAYICGATHNYNKSSFDYIMKEIVIEPYTWICAKSIVLPGVCCKEGSVLGAGAVIVKDMEPWTVYTGNPATPIKMRNNFLLNDVEVL
jgi:putative colanic acid biosynthesis acetyltransferase WcaF